jgi:non-ribosomal peptide synthetase component F
MTEILIQYGMHLEYWRSVLRGAPTGVGIPVTSAVGHRPLPAAPQPVAASPAGVAALDGTAGMLAAWAALLYRASGQRDLVIGTAFGQPAALLPVRLNVTGDMTFARLTAAARDALAAAREHAGVQFGSLAGILGHSGPGPVIQAWLTDADAPAPPGGAPFPLRLVTAPRDGTAPLAIAYDGAVFARPTVARLALQLARLIDALTEAPDDRVAGHAPLEPDNWVISPVARPRCPAAGGQRPGSVSATTQ